MHYAYDTSKSFLSKATFERKLSDVAHLRRFLLAKVNFQK